MAVKTFIHNIVVTMLLTEYNIIFRGLAFATISSLFYWNCYNIVGNHSFIVLMKSTCSATTGLRPALQPLLLSCFKLTTSRVRRLPVNPSVVSYGSGGFGRIKCSVLISGCPRAVDRLSGIAPCARRWGNRPRTIVGLHAGFRPSGETVASGHCRNMADHRMDASGLILRSGDHGDVAGST
jgi:hypothetical protein